MSRSKTTTDRSPLDFGLTRRDWQTLLDILRQFPEISKVKLFGSRALGTYTFSSDIDLAIMNTGVSDRTIRRLKAAFSESSLPYFVDVVNVSAVEQPELLSQITQSGTLLYESSDQSHSVQ